jgi:hypothetical protein
MRVTVRLLLIAVTACAVAGCARSGTSSGSAPFPALPGNLTVEAAGDDGMWLPSPGLSSRILHRGDERYPARVPLPPTAEAARQRGLAAARLEDWPSAITAFKEAMRSAHADPTLYYNLALAYQRAGILVPAAMWYRAYLAAESNPAMADDYFGSGDAEDAPAVRMETERLIAEIEARALKLFCSMKPNA